MSLKSVIYIGVFPPPFGGVTVKNSLIFDKLRNFTECKKLDLIKWYSCILNILKLPFIYQNESSIIIGLDTKRLRFILRLITFTSNCLERSSFFLMGGQSANTISDDPFMSRKLRKGKKILVETVGMKTTLENCGFSNVEIFPNCRTINNSVAPRFENSSGPIRLVFMSRICREKGIDHLIRAINKIEKEDINCCTIDFYGPIDTNIKEEFINFIDACKIATYGGILDSKIVDIYKKLNQYDAMLFPSEWKAEGVPGVLVEAKMAGIAVVASDVAYNEEIINEKNNEGIIIHGDLELGLIKAIRLLSKDRELVNSLKTGSYDSRERYSLEHYDELLYKLIK